MSDEDEATFEERIEASWRGVNAAAECPKKKNNFAR